MFPVVDRVARSALARTSPAAKFKSDVVAGGVMASGVTVRKLFTVPLAAVTLRAAAVGLPLT